MAERGANVLGVEVAPRMAETARSHGIEVEVGAFQDWDALTAPSTGSPRRRPGTGLTCRSVQRRRLRCCGLEAGFVFLERRMSSRRSSRCSR